jgi:hypothetical protein
MEASNIEAALIATAQAFWDAEAEITRRFFAGKPDREAYLRFLKAAVYKELNPVIGYGPSTGFANGLHMEFHSLIARFAGLDDGIDRRDMLARLEMMTEEFAHYVVLAEVLEFVLGRPLRADDAAQLPEDEKLNAMRRHYVESDDPCLAAAMGLTEGGGASAFREAARLSGGEIEDRLAAAMKVIHRDEEHHYLDAARAAADAVGSTDDLARMKHALREVSIQRVRMRNEMFSEPMTEAEIDRLIADNPE